MVIFLYFSFLEAINANTFSRDEVQVKGLAVDSEPVAHVIRLYNPWLKSISLRMRRRDSRDKDTRGTRAKIHIYYIYIYIDIKTNNHISTILTLSLIFDRWRTRADTVQFSLGHTLSYTTNTFHL